MTSPALERARQQLAELIEAAELEIEQAAQRAAIQARAEAEAMQQAAAQAMEDLSVDNAVRSAYEQGRRDKQLQVLALISEQSHMLGRAGFNSLSLTTLKRRIEEAA